MGSIFDSVSKLAGGLMGGQSGECAPDHAAVAGGLVQELSGTGVGNLIQTLLANHLIDRMHIWTLPLTLGSGKRCGFSTKRNA